MSDNYRRNNQVYIVGSNATKLDTYQENETRTTTEHRQVRHVNRQAMERRYRYKMKLACLLAVTMFMCIVMVKTQLSVSATSKDIVNLEKELGSLKKKNSLLVENMSNNVGLEQVYEIATTKLGMVMPGASQIGSIQVKAGSYTQQFAEIEGKVKKEDGVSNILGFIFSN